MSYFDEDGNYIREDESLDAVVDDSIDYSEDVDEYSDPFVNFLDSAGETLQGAGNAIGSGFDWLNQAIVQPNDSYKQATQAAGVDRATDYLGILAENEPGQQITNILEDAGVPGHEEFGFEVGPVQIGPRELIGFAAGNLLMPGGGSADDAAKLASKPGMRRFYHGTADDFTTPDWERFDKNSLKGPGYYVTDDPRVAGTGDLNKPGYAESRGMMKPVDPAQQLTYEDRDVMIEKLQDYIGPSVGGQRIEDVVDDIISSANDTKMPLNYAKKDVELWLKENVEDFENTPQSVARNVVMDLPTWYPKGMNVRAVDIPDDLPILYAETPLEDIDLNNIVQTAMKHTGDPGTGTYFEEFLESLNTLKSNNDSPSYLSGNGWDIADTSAGITGQDIYGLLARTLGGMEGAQDFLQEAGYFGLQHAGGTIMPMYDDLGNAITHNAITLFPNSKSFIYNSTSGKRGGMTVPLNLTGDDEE